MQFFKSGNRHVIGLKGGQFESFHEEAYAIILDEPPIPNRKWESPYLNYKSEHNETYRTQCTFWEYNSGEKQIYILQVEETRIDPAYSVCIMEFFVERDYVDRKVEQLRKFNQLATYEWDIKNTNWIEVERNFEYEDNDDPVIFPTLIGKPLH